MTDFAKAFQKDQNNISDAVKEISPLLVKLSRLIAQTHMTFWIYPLFTLTLFNTSQKSSSERKNFFVN